MQYLRFDAPPFPYYAASGNALYRPGDRHRRRAEIGFFDLIVVERGTLYMETMNSRYTVSAGGVLVIPEKTPHGGWKNCEESTLFHWLHFDCCGAYQVTDSSTYVHRRATSTLTINNHDLSMGFVMPVFQMLDPDRTQSVHAKMVQLESLSFNKFLQNVALIGNPYNALERQSLFMQLMSELADVQEKAKGNSVASQAMQYIHLHFSDQLTLSSIAEALNYHPTHIIRSMKQQYGCTPNKIILELRIQRVRSLLGTTDLDLAEIADMTGFSTSSYLCKVFKAQTGMTPLAYRMQQLHAVSGHRAWDRES
ncbi:MAG: AraC family transcriptional regulator [Candidatus Limiplasma sp.]|nr:AraC family transcriptional regulator [Candidatus Limiplasma sp.]